MFFGSAARAALLCVVLAAAGRNHHYHHHHHHHNDHGEKGLPRLAVALAGNNLSAQEKHDVAVESSHAPTEEKREEKTAVWEAQQKEQPDGFVKPLRSGGHKLRVCNAYPYDQALDVYRGAEKLTGGAPMEYKTCRDFVAGVKDGDKLDFKADTDGVGAFSVSALPAGHSVLLLVIHRRDVVSSAAAFQSHVFTEQANAQVAIIDTYKGDAKSSPHIADKKDGVLRKGRSEELRYDSVVAVSPGTYRVALEGADGLAQSSRDLVALGGEGYVVLRTGVEAQYGPSYTQDLVVFPMSDPALLPKSGGSASSSPALLALTTLAAAVASAAVRW